MSGNILKVVACKVKLYELILRDQDRIDDDDDKKDENKEEIEEKHDIYDDKEQPESDDE